MFRGENDASLAKMSALLPMSANWSGPGPYHNWVTFRYRLQQGRLIAVRNADSIMNLVISGRNIDTALSLNRASVHSRVRDHATPHIIRAGRIAYDEKEKRLITRRC